MRKTLKVFSVLYWIAVGFFVLIAILTFASGSALDTIKESFPVALDGADPKIVFGIEFIIMAVIYAVIAVSMRNVATKKSNGTVALVFLAISAMLLYFVICVRKENEAK